jgi:ABC-type Na+ efflux pump permease subunit
MRFIWSTATKDLKRIARNPTEVAIWLGIPLLIGSLITAVSGGKGGPTPKAHVLVADQDSSFASTLLLGAMSRAAGGEMIEAERVSQDEGRRRVQRGKATALLIIPRGFGDAVVNDTQTTLELLTNPAQRILPGIVEEILSVFVDGIFYVHRLIGDDLKALANGPPDGSSTFSDKTIANFSVKINQVIRRISASVFPPIIQVTAAVDEEKDEPSNTVSMALFFVPGILFMSLLFMGQGIAEDLWQERDHKTLRRVVVSPQRVTDFLIGKVLAGSIVIFIVVVVALCIGYAYFGLGIATFPLAVLWATFSGALLMTGMMIIQVYATSQRAANIVTMTLIFPLMMVGGSFFPFEAMPAWMAAIGTKTPNGWAIVQLKAILLARAHPGSLGAAFLGLAVTGTILFLLTARRLRSGFAQS